MILKITWAIPSRNFGGFYRGNRHCVEKPFPFTDDNKSLYQNEYLVNQDFDPRRYAQIVTVSMMFMTSWWWWMISMFPVIRWGLFSSQNIPIWWHSSLFTLHWHPMRVMCFWNQQHFDCLFNSSYMIITMKHQKTSKLALLIESVHIVMIPSFHSVVWVKNKHCGM